ncbi:hypothetical protein SHIRM173S_07541 [Streptomyces hirsutus]
MVVSEAARPGCRRAKVWASSAPQEAPARCTGSSMPSRSRAAVYRSTMWSRDISPRVRVAPTPG